MSEKPAELKATDVMTLSPVIPVVTIESPETAVPMAQALAAGGIGIIEVTLRTPSALESLRRIVHDVPDMTVGAGTVLDPSQAENAVEAGAEFLVSPGLSTALSKWIRSTDLPFLAGVSNLGQIMDARDQGLTELKFFPAEPAGGTAYLKAIAGPIHDVTFCPTGGITPGNAAEYLQLGNVPCVGGSWLTPKEAVTSGDYDEITRQAKRAAALA